MFANYKSQKTINQLLICKCFGIMLIETNKRIEVRNKMELITLFISAVLINNIILTKYLALQVQMKLEL